MANAAANVQKMCRHEGTQVSQSGRAKNPANMRESMAQLYVTGPRWAGLHEGKGAQWNQRWVSKQSEINVSLRVSAQLWRDEKVETCLQSPLTERDGE